MTAISASGAIIPVIVGMVNGETITAIGGLGIVGTLAGVALATFAASETSSSDASSRQTTLLFAVVASIGFGGYFCLFTEASRGGVAVASLLEGIVSVICLASAWGVMKLRGTGRVVVTLVPHLDALVTCGSLGTRIVDTATKHWPVLLTAAGIATSGLLDLGATTLFAHASVAGRLGVTATLGSLYPVVTIILSRLVLDERPGNIQSLGVLLAVGGTVLATM